MTIRKVIGSDDIVALYHGEKIPCRGLAMRGALVYEDGSLLGVAHGTALAPAIQYRVEPRGNTVEVRYQPWSEAFAAYQAQVKAA